MKRPKLSSEIPKNMQNLLERCWNKDPKMRPSFTEIFKLLSSDFTHSPEDVDEDETMEYLETIKRSDEKIDIKEKMIQVYLDITKMQLLKTSDLCDIFIYVIQSGNVQVVEYFLSNVLIDINMNIISK